MHTEYPDNTKYEAQEKIMWWWDTLGRYKTEKEAQQDINRNIEAHKKLMANKVTVEIIKYP